MKLKSNNDIVNFIALVFSIIVIYYLITILYSIILVIKPDSVWYKEGFFSFWFVCSIILIRLELN